MDFISELLQPYKEAIGQTAGAVTFLHMLSGVVLLNDIRKKKTTSGGSVMPFLGGLIV